MPRCFPHTTCGKPVLKKEVFPHAHIVHNKTTTTHTGFPQARVVKFQEPVLTGNLFHSFHTP